MINLSTEIQESLAGTNAGELKTARLIRLAAALETKLEALQHRIDQRTADYERAKRERDDERKRRVELELQLSDAEKHRDSLATMLERRRIEREVAP